jgi:hypothetical protein
MRRGCHAVAKARAGGAVRVTRAGGPRSRGVPLDQAESRPVRHDAPAEEERVMSRNLTLWLAAFAVVLIAGTAVPALMRTRVTRAEVTRAMQGWPQTPRKVADTMIAKYGLPDEATRSMLVWNGNGPWKRSILYRDEVPHHFPMEHTDVLEQFIDYRAPLERYDELAAYDGSVIVERTKGEISARCDKEAMNFLALNLANEIANGTKTVEEARRTYAAAAMDFMQGRSSPDVEGFRFNVRAGGTADPDSPLQASGQ